MPAHIAAIVKTRELVLHGHFKTLLHIVPQTIRVALSAQLRPDPRDQFVLVHRPREVVVHAHLECLSQLAPVALGHQHKDRNVSALG